MNILKNFFKKKKRTHLEAFGKLESGNEKVLKKFCKKVLKRGGENENEIFLIKNDKNKNNDIKKYNFNGERDECQNKENIKDKIPIKIKKKNLYETVLTKKDIINENVDKKKLKYRNNTKRENINCNKNEKIIVNKSEYNNNINQYQLDEENKDKNISNIEDITKYIYITNNNLEINLDMIKNKQFEKSLFIKENITGVGNCLYRCISYHFFHDEYSYNIIRNLVYQYVKSNQNEILEYCDIENNNVIVKIELNSKIIKYGIEDYINKIKEDGFYGGFIEIYSISKIYNKHIVILRPNNDNISFYNIIMIYNNTKKKIL